MTFLFSNTKDRILGALKKVFVFNKRLVILVAMSFLIAMMLVVNPSVQKGTSATVLDSKSAFNTAKENIKGDSSWFPRGWGSGEYLSTLPVIKAGAVLNFETGDVIWSMNLKQRIAPASLSKLATVSTALDLARKDHLISVSGAASDQVPTILGLKTGEKLTLDEAASGAIMTSANDAAQAIADSIGTEYNLGLSGFMDLVNFKLSKIGALDSHFINATGLDDPNHFSTIYDLAIIAHDAKVNYPDIANDAATLYKRLDANQNHKLYDLPNWNALLGTYPGVDGLKIGYTERAGYSTIVTAERNGYRLMAIVSGAGSIKDRDMAAATLLNYGFSKYSISPFPLNNFDLTKRFNDWRQELSGEN